MSDGSQSGTNACEMNKRDSEEIGRVLISCLVSENTGVRINKIKTKLMRVNTKKEDSVFLGHESIEDVEDFTYLGSNISKNSGADRNIQARFGKARSSVCHAATRMAIESDIQKDQATHIQQQR